MQHSLQHWSSSTTCQCSQRGSYRLLPLNQGLPSQRPADSHMPGPLPAAARAAGRGLVAETMAAAPRHVKQKGRQAVSVTVAGESDGPRPAMRGRGLPALPQGLPAGDQPQRRVSSATTQRAKPLVSAAAGYVSTAASGPAGAGPLLAPAAAAATAIATPATTISTFSTLTTEPTPTVNVEDESQYGFEFDVVPEPLAQLLTQAAAAPPSPREQQQQQVYGAAGPAEPGELPAMAAGLPAASSSRANGRRRRAQASPGAALQPQQEKPQPAIQPQQHASRWLTQLAGSDADDSSNDSVSLLALVEDEPGADANAEGGSSAATAWGTYGPEAARRARSRVSASPSPSPAPAAASETTGAPTQRPRDHWWQLPWAEALRSVQPATLRELGAMTSPLAEGPDGASRFTAAGAAPVTLFVKGLPAQAPEALVRAALVAAFSEATGPLVQVRIPTRALPDGSRELRGIAFLVCSTPEAKARACALPAPFVLGRWLQLDVNPDVARPAARGSTQQQPRELRRQRQQASEQSTTQQQQPQQLAKVSLTRRTSSTPAISRHSSSQADQGQGRARRGRYLG